MTPEAWARLDERTVAALLATSPIAVRRRYADERARGVSAYDPTPLGPRDYWARCAGCGGRGLVVTPRNPSVRYCSDTCRSAAYHRRHRDRVLDRQKAYQARRRAEARGRVA